MSSFLRDSSHYTESKWWLSGAAGDGRWVKANGPGREEKQVLEFHHVAPKGQKGRLGTFLPQGNPDLNIKCVVKHQMVPHKYIRIFCLYSNTWKVKGLYFFLYIQ